MNDGISERLVGICSFEKKMVAAAAHYHFAADRHIGGIGSRISYITFHLFFILI
jgi:hypothetical protein